MSLPITWVCTVFSLLLLFPSPPLSVDHAIDII
jgi:hypothetical protein